MSEVVRTHYGGHAMQEWERLDRPYARLEFACTRASPPKSGNQFQNRLAPG